MHYLDHPFSVDTTARHAPLIVFAIKEPSKLMSILEKKEEKKSYTQMELFKFHIDFFLGVARGMVVI